MLWGSPNQPTWRDRETTSKERYMASPIPTSCSSSSHCLTARASDALSQNCQGEPFQNSWPTETTRESDRSIHVQCIIDIFGFKLILILICPTSFCSFFLLSWLLFFVFNYINCYSVYIIFFMCFFYSKIDLYLKYYIIFQSTNMSV